MGEMYMPDYNGYARAFERAGVPYTIDSDAHLIGHGDIPANKVKYIVVHHTAGGYDRASEDIVKYGHSGLRGLLSQMVFKRDGSIRVVGMGVAYHAPSYINFRGVPAKSGNYWSLGIEGMSRGTHDDWTPQQRENYPKVVAALLVDLGLDDKAFAFHRELQYDKVDPVAWDKADFQNKVTYWYNKIKGETATVPTKTAIETLAENLKLGSPTTPERTCPDKIGKNRVYQDGKTIVYWTPQTPAAAVGGDNLEKYAKIGYEKSVLGYPVTSEVKIRDAGTYQRFQRGNMYHTPKYGSKIVHGAIFNKWGDLNYENGPLGYPITDELVAPDEKGRYNEFEFGTLYWSPDTGAHEIHGLILKAFEKAGGLEKVGYPTTDERATPDKSGMYNHFENGSIYWKKGRPEAIFVPKWVINVWSQLGWEQGKLGYPTGDVVTENGIDQQAFEAGTIGFDTDLNQTLIRIDGKWEPIQVAEPTEKKTEPKSPRPELKVGDIVVDYSAGVPAAADVKKAGYKGAVRYISPARDAWMKGKPMSKREFDDYKSNGLQVAFVFQNLKQDWSRGRNGGIEDAKAAKKHIEMLGAPDAVVYCAIDHNLADKSTDAVKIWNSTAAKYIQGFQSVMGREKTGIYANNLCISWAIEDNLGTYYWQHDWSNDIPVNGRWTRLTGVNKNAHIHQFPFRKGDNVAGIDIDRNEVLKPYFGQV